jgi:xylan 1,4-beta-xylosidase
VPIYITEFTSDAIPRATINDTCFKSAFIVKTAIDLYDKVDCMGYWQLSDLTQEYQDANMILYGGNGLLSRHGIQKCGYFAYWFLGKLNMDILDCGKNHIVTAGTDNNYAVIVHNYKNLSNSYCTEYFKESKNYSYSELLDDTCPLHFKYLISGVHPGKYIIKKYTLNSRHGNLLGVVDELHCESYAGNEELEYLSRICVPQEQLSCVECTETLDLEATLEPLEVVLFTVSKHLD